MKTYYLMHMGIDLTVAIPHRRFNFIYKDRHFKFESTFSNLYADVLSTITEDTDSSRSEALKCAQEWAAGLAFDSHAACKVTYLGGAGADARTNLSKSRDLHLDFRSAPVGHRSYSTGDVGSIMDITDDDQLRAIQIYNLGRISSDIYSELVYYWQVLEVKALGMTASQWIDALPTKALGLIKDDIRRLPLGSKSLGNYLYEDCRNAIAHLRRWRKGYVSLDFNDLKDVNRIQVSLFVLQHLATHYLEHVLNLRERRHLYSIPQQNHPVYLALQEAVDLHARAPRGVRITKFGEKWIRRMQRGLNCGIKHPSETRRRRRKPQRAPDPPGPSSREIQHPL